MKQQSSCSASFTYDPLVLALRYGYDVEDPYIT